MSKPVVGSRRQRWAAVGAGALTVALLVSGCSAAAAPKPEKYGGVASYLPKSSTVADGELRGTAARPALTTEGDAVRVTLGGATAVATVTGPEVPGEGLPYVTSATTCTWSITVVGVSGRMPLALADFSTLDHLGGTYSPYLVAGQPGLPATIGPGEKVTVQVRAVMKVGEGVMRWAPAGQGVVASWDFEVEND